MSNFLRSITMHSITSDKIRKLNQELMSNLKLKEEVIRKENPICGRLMRFVEILLKSYSFARRLALIESEVEGDGDGDGDGEGEGQGGKSLGSIHKV